MTPAQFQKLFESKLNELKRYAREDLPRHVGKLAVDHFHENFMLGGFVDDKLEPWRPSKRIGQDKSAASGYGTLLSSRKELYNSIRSIASEGKVTISSSLRYSRIHNEGGTVTQTITPKMRRFAWAKYYQANPGGKGEGGGMWKAMALTKKTTRTFIIPKRKYMGHSVEINRQIELRVAKDFKRILFSN
jgi:phage gpG-like protein